MDEMMSQLSEIWKFRFFWLSLVKMDLKLRYRGTVLGIGWSLLQPILMTVVFCVIFSSWHGRAEWRYDAPYFLAGLTIFGFIRDSVTWGCQNFFKNEPYIRQCPLPLAIYPLRTILGLIIHFGISLSVTIASVLLLTPGSGLDRIVALAASLPALGLLFIFGWSISVLAGFAQVYFQDVQHLSDVVFQIFFFLTPILFKTDLLIEKGVGWLGTYNPVVWFLELIRTPLLTGEFAATHYYGYASAVTAVTLTGALLTMKHLEKRIIFHL